jgi:coenzyme PQQ biosynthesis protein PqqD
MTRGSRPSLAPRARLRFDRRSGRRLLLYPERGLLLTETAAEIVGLLDGQRTIAAIVDTLVAAHGGGARAAIERDVLAFLDALAARALLRVEPEC